MPTRVVQRCRRVVALVPHVQMGTVIPYSVEVDGGGLSKKTFEPSLEIALVVVPVVFAGSNGMAEIARRYRETAPSGLTSVATAAPAAWSWARPALSAMCVASGTDRDVHCFLRGARVDGDLLARVEVRRARNGQLVSPS